MDYLIHYGVQGQRRGYRRWQNEDGSLTPAGREHYGVGAARVLRNMRENRLRKTAGKIDTYKRKLSNPDTAIKQAKALEVQAKRDERYNRAQYRYMTKQAKADRSFMLRDYRQIKADRALRESKRAYKRKTQSDARVSRLVKENAKIEYKKLAAEKKFDRLSSRYIRQYSQEYYDAIFKIEKEQQ